MREKGKNRQGRPRRFFLSPLETPVRQRSITNNEPLKVPQRSFLGTPMLTELNNWYHNNFDALWVQIIGGAVGAIIVAVLAVVFIKGPTKVFSWLFRRGKAISHTVPTAILAPQEPIRVIIETPAKSNELSEHAKRLLAYAFLDSRPMISKCYSSSGASIQAGGIEMVEPRSQDQISDAVIAIEELETASLIRQTLFHPHPAWELTGEGLKTARTLPKPERLLPKEAVIKEPESVKQEPLRVEVVDRPDAATGVLDILVRIWNTSLHPIHLGPMWLIIRDKAYPAQSHLFKTSIWESVGNSQPVDKWIQPTELRQYRPYQGQVTSCDMARLAQRFFQMQAFVEIELSTGVLSIPITDSKLHLWILHGKTWLPVPKSPESGSAIAPENRSEGIRQIQSDLQSIAQGLDAIVIPPHFDSTENRFAFLGDVSIEQLRILRVLRSAKQKGLLKEPLPLDDDPNHPGDEIYVWPKLATFVEGKWPGSIHSLKDLGYPLEQYGDLVQDSRGRKFWAAPKQTIVKHRDHAKAMISCILARCLA